ncbi:MAG: hypothetical protein ABR587_13505 [Candidatus Binatia bacterium]
MSATDPAGTPAPTPGDGARGAKLGGSERESALPRAVGTWRRAYALVIAALAADVVLLWLLGRLV